ncbi:hypothetical protein FACS189487_11070 [Campylobacterota bacterium]|nr:hypothetical protein FACS189487_11070 [Campylobacterota bacterium]
MGIEIMRKLFLVVLAIALAQADENLGCLEADGNCSENGKLSGFEPICGEKENGAKENGTEKCYFENGNLSLETVYKKGRKHNAKMYRKDGKILAIVEYENGIPKDGVCFNAAGRKTAMTIVEIIDWHNGIRPECE